MFPCRKQSLRSTQNLLADWMEGGEKEEESQVILRLETSKKGGQFGLH